MSPGPLRRITAAIGLLALAPIAAMMLTSALTPQEAAARAVLVVVVVLLVGNLVRVIITQLLHRVERDLPEVTDTGEGQHLGAAAAPASERGQRRPGAANPRAGTAGAGAGAVAAGGGATTASSGGSPAPGSSVAPAADGELPRRRAEDQMDAARR